MARKGTRLFGSLAEAAAAGAIDGNDPGVQQLVAQERQKKEQEESSKETPAGEELYKVLFIGDKSLAHELSEGNERISSSHYLDPIQHSLDHICKYLAGVMNTPDQPDAICFCNTDLSYIKEFCQDRGLGTSGGYGMVVVYVGPVDLGEVTQTVKDTFFGFNPEKADGMPFLLQMQLADKIEEGREWLSKFRPATIVIANGGSAGVYAEIERKGFPVIPYPPTKEGCSGAMRLLCSPTSDIGVIVIDVTAGFEKYHEALLEATLEGSHTNTRRVFVGVHDSELGNYARFMPYDRRETHEDVASGLKRLVEGFNPADTPTTDPNGIPSIKEDGTTRVYDRDGRMTEVIGKGGVRRKSFDSES